MSKISLHEAEGRREARAQFLKEAGWAQAAAAPLTADASTRAYERLRDGEKTALLMNAPPAAEGAACPREADDEERRRLGYNAMARLAGPNLNAFIAVADALRGAGLSAPEVFAADPDEGFALIEDLGDDLFARAIPAGAPEATLYETAIDALLALRAAAPAPPSTDGYCMLTYDHLAMEAEVSLLSEWYCAHKTGEAPSPDLHQAYIAAWKQTLGKLRGPYLMVLRDFHAENLLWLPQRKGATRAGLIDFQDGLIGHGAYDLVSLLEDARRDVSPAVTDAMFDRYCKGAAQMSPRFDREEFAREYAILGAQRNAKILGIFARLIRRDGKPRYQQFIPRVEAHFRRDLEHPDLAPIRKAVADMAPELLS